MAEVKVPLNEKRKLEIEGAINFRDMGGYQTGDGRTVVQGKFFRSGDLSKLTDAGLQQLKQLNIWKICDFRSKNEISENPDPIIEQAEHVHMPVIPKNEKILDPKQQMERYMKLVQQNQGEQMMVDLYCTMVEQKNVWRDLLHLLMDDNSGPFIIHCTAGKDRTGVGSALILKTLGVSETVILEDYEKTNEAIEQLKHLTKGTIPAELEEDLKEKVKEAGTAMVSAKRIYIQAYFDEINRLYGSFDHYLEEGLGISKEMRQKLQDKYLV
ncbi:tyrosine-protein phosphatase [Gracilibacillus caseinilyticus]|uniref:Tyrosine-protein phosphatase n=1 Tax=Gracilibacillus caseinilyticus TaxID=2932256 RepID=A0ABY4EZU6_9BACI|nr:tyrosine-protein phosphatase [Gracilibacillus caseinilyticus]UOQ49926.1 tyrosine-protein phosphatase [Gracilibacillus caseinilyticus]